jgi:meso-butanediol dehydrogenase/(S,S)-butanediol dehydrogenase/diacetyl reductase
MKLEGKVALVTGGGQGIGRGIVHCLAEEGADVAIADMNEETAGTTAEEVTAMGRQSLVVTGNVTDSSQVDSIIQKPIDTFGRIDILVNNVGGGVRVKRTKPKEERTGIILADAEEEAWDKTMDLNAKSQFLMCRAIIPHFVEQKAGKIVNIGSRLSRQLDLSLALYCVSKAAVISYTKHLALELAQYNINVNAVCPGDVLSPNIERAFQMGIDANPDNKGKTPEDMFNELAGPRIAFNHIQTAEDMGRATTFLVSEDAKNITGQALYVDGGQTFI